MKNEISNILNLIENGDTFKALERAKLFYKKDQNNLDAIKLLAYSYIQLGNFEQVIEVLEQGYNKRKDQRDFDYFNNMGYSLSQIEEYEDSISHLKRAQELKNGPSVKTCLAEVYLKQRNFTQAGEMILSALDAGADCVKLQTVNVEESYLPDTDSYKILL